MFGHKNDTSGAPVFRLIVVSLLLAISAFIFSVATPVRADDAERLFTDFNPNSGIKVDYGPWSDVLELSVWDTGRSDRTYARPQIPRLGSRIAQGNPNPTRLEANRVFYHLLGDEQVDFITEYKATLEAIPSQVSLSRFSRNEQLVFWLNLYTVTVYEHVARNYPITMLGDMRAPGGLFDQKVLNIEGVALSLRDIEQRVLTNWDNPLVIYGLYQGAIGGPNIRTKAYNGEDVYQQLESNAREFINSLRGLRFRDVEAKASEFYAWNSHFFPDFKYHLRNHLMQYADADVALRLASTLRLETDVYDWYIADLYNGRFSAGASSDNPAEFVLGQDFGQQGGSAQGPQDPLSLAQPGGMAGAQANSFSRVSPPSGYPEHVRMFIQEIRIRNITNRRGRVVIDEVDSDTTIVDEPDDEGNN